MLFIYCRPPTKLGEGNVFSGVCLLGVPHDYYPWCIRPQPMYSSLAPSPVQGPTPSLYRILPSASGIWWTTLEAWSNLLLEDLTVQSPLMVLTSGGYTEAHVVGEQAVRILLECFLVSINTNVASILYNVYAWNAFASLPWVKRTLYQGFCQQNNRKLLPVTKFKFSQEMEGW